MMDGLRMRRDRAGNFFRLLAMALCSCALITPVARGSAEERAVAIAFFELHVRPTLIGRCFSCHGPTAQPPRGNLRLDTRAVLLAARGAGKPALIVPGDPDKSEIVILLRHGIEDVNALPAHRLTADQLVDIETWVRRDAITPDDNLAPSGAPVPHPDLSAARKFWSLRPVQEQPLPAVHLPAWSQNPIDRFVLAKMQEKGVHPVAAADKRTLLRRATFDLTGLPPTPEEIIAFLADTSPDAFAHVIDRLLASPRYGERWGRHWLDVAHYSDTAGEDADFPIPEAARYRDWVIDAFNQDKPYEQFVKEQIVGDLMPARDEADRRQKIIATGYLAMSRRFGVAPEHEMQLTIADTIDTLGRSVLGATLGCARCHDHKFDPFSMRDYYALYGIFESTNYAFPGSEERPFQIGFAPLIDPAKASEVLKPYEASLAAAEADVRRTFDARAKATDAPTYQRLTGEWERAKNHRNDVSHHAPVIEAAYGVSEGTPHDACIQKRGEPGDPGDSIARGFPEVLGGQRLPPDEHGSGRLPLSNWLTDPANPLFARVMVNRIWQYHFGKGIVQTPSDFGNRGKPPTHPELLDFLAKRFVDSGWSIKAMHRLVMTSQAYQLSATDDAANTQADAADDFLWQFRRQRLDAEEIRDAILAVSGNLDLSRPGPHPFPPRDGWHFTQHAAFAAIYPSMHRGVYVMQQRIKRHPFFVLFDGADPNLSTAERSVSVTPLQALFMMNDPFVEEESMAFAGRLRTARDTQDGQIELAYELAYGRPPEADEYSEARAYLAQYVQKLAATNIPAGKRETAALASHLRSIFSSNEFLFVE